MKRGLMLLIVLVVLTCAGCQGTTPSSPPSPSPEPPQQVFSLEVTEPQDESVVDTSPIPVRGITSPGAEVSINGELIDVDGQGSFAAMVELEEGPNVIEVVATDYEGNEEYCIVAVIYAP